MIRVGVLDHHLNNYHADKFLSLLRGPLASEGVEIAAAWESHPTGDDWCARQGVPRAGSPDEAIRGMDAILILAPDNVEAHLEMARMALPAGKPTFIDKFLASTGEEARRIVDLAEKSGAPLFSASSLRYAVELEDALPALGASVPECHARGLGSWAGYGVHTLSMALRLMGSTPRRLIDTGTPSGRVVTLDYGGGRRAVAEVRTASNEWDVLGWAFGGRAGDAWVAATVRDYDGFYANLMRRVAAFFRTGVSDMAPREALMVVDVLESADRSLSAGGEWVPLSA